MAPPPSPSTNRRWGKCERGGLWLGRHRHRTRPSKFHSQAITSNHQQQPSKTFALGTQPSRQPASQPAKVEAVPPVVPRKCEQAKGDGETDNEAPLGQGKSLRDRPWRQCLIHPNEAPESGVVSYPEPERVRCLKLRQPLSHTNVRPVRRRPPRVDGGSPRPEPPPEPAGQTRSRDVCERGSRPSAPRAGSCSR